MNATTVLHIHLLLGLIFLIGLWRSQSFWPKLGLIAGVLLVVTGAYNFMTRMSGPPPGWHAAIGIKILLGLHAITMAFLISRGNADAAKLARWKRGGLISAVLTILIGLYYSNFARG